ncbi:hypothetical protein RND71_028254 [Anisodus tanguticus]|uniref:ALBINO3-like protein 2, chloroplastic n=1 Tax=Anisodus tanguticus TaxID=243964 RepID=A0AAE1V6Y5_9SOLA|nr:hypothetical protein RND71_028254 [Anisodus tanguticus]
MSVQRCSQLRRYTRNSPEIYFLHNFTSSDSHSKPSNPPNHYRRGHSRYVHFLNSLLPSQPQLVLPNSVSFCRSFFTRDSRIGDSVVENTALLISENVSASVEESIFPVRALMSLLDGCHDLTGFPWCSSSSSCYLLEDIFSVFDPGGTLWFQNLTELPSGVLGPVFPLLIAGLHYVNVQSFMKGLRDLYLLLVLSLVFDSQHDQFRVVNHHLMFRHVLTVPTLQCWWVLDTVSLALVNDGRLGSCSRSGTEARIRRGKWGKGDARLRIGFWNIGTLTRKSIELVKILKKMRINIACVQETKWVGPKAKDVDGISYGSRVSFQKSSVGKMSGFLGLLAKYYKMYLEVLTLPLLFITFNMPQGSLVYWLTNSSMTVVQQLSLNRPDVRKKLGLPQKDPQLAAAHQKELDNPGDIKIDPSKNQRKISVQNLAPRELVNLSIKLLAGGRKDEAMSSLRLALTKDPESVQALLIIGQTLLQDGSLPEATEYLEHAIAKILLKENQMEIEDVDLLILSSQWAGVACIRQGKMEDGLVHLERIATLKEPEDPKSKAHYYDGLVLLSSALMNVGRKNDAINYLQMATAYNESYREFLQQCENEEDDITNDLVTSRRGDY